MAIQRKISVGMDAVFPAGAFLVGQVESVYDFRPEIKRPNGSRPSRWTGQGGLIMTVETLPRLDRRRLHVAAVAGAVWRPSG